MADDLTSRLEACYTGAVHDVMRAMGLRATTLPPEIRPLFPERKLAGPVHTVSGHVDESADAHTTLLEWTGVLSKARPGTVMVCQPNHHTVAMMGELSAETLKLKGVRGYIVDGGARDIDFILELGFPICCRFYTPRDIVGYWLPDGFGVPITIGEVTIHDGDWVLADRDGIVVIPQAQAAEVVAATERTIAQENLVRRAILAGMDPQEAYRTYGKF